LRKQNFTAKDTVITAKIVFVRDLSALCGDIILPAVPDCPVFPAVSVCSRPAMVELS
jgi:hypothetical protein